MTHETLDETIDRVAGGLTRGAADPALTMHIRERLAAPQRASVRMGTGALAAIAAVLVLAFWLMPPRPAPAPAEAHALRAAPLAPLAPHAGAVYATIAAHHRAEAVEREGRTPAADPRPAQRSDTPAPIETDLPALAIAPLEVGPLPVGEVVVAPLHVDPLPLIPELHQDTKEPR